LPGTTDVLTAAHFDHSRSSSLLEGLSTGLPGVTLGDQSGNPFQRDLNYRGFIASPVSGTPQGLAIFQNGIRINESFNDVVNWAFIPETAIQRVSLVSNNPIYGLNAIGGALNIEMKTVLHIRASKPRRSSVPTAASRAQPSSARRMPDDPSMRPPTR
jgi:iron complex outermembrane receptor protein